MEDNKPFETLHSLQIDYLHENLSYNDVIIILEDGWEYDGDTVGFRFHIHRFVITVRDHRCFFAVLFFLQKVEVAFENRRKTVAFQQTNLFD